MKTEDSIKEMQDTVFAYVEKIKDLLSPELWQSQLTDCSKNEILILWDLFRHEEANMTQLAAYIHVPLNTATGIVGRMEKKKFVTRFHSPVDKRIVMIRLGEQGRIQMQQMISMLMRYGQKVLSGFSAEEINLLGRMMDQLLKVFTEEQGERENRTTHKKIRKIEIE